MVNVKFANYEDFVKFFSKAPRNVQNILFKAYPEYGKKMASDYMNSIKKVGTKAKETVTNPTKAMETIKSQAKAGAKSINDTFQSALGKVNKATENIKGTGTKTNSKASGFKPTKLGTAGAIWGIADPKTSWNQKILSGGLAFPATAPYAAAGLVTTAVAPAGIDAYYDRKFEKDTRYNLPEGHLPNEFNLAPELKELTPEERDKYSQYFFKDTKDMINRGSNMLQEEIDKWDNLIDNNFEQEYLNQISGNNTVATSIPSQPTINPNISRQPVNNTQNVQNALQPRVNINQDTNIVPNYQQALTANVAPVNYQFDIPDYKTLNIAIQDDISKLQDMVNKENTPMNNQGNTAAGSEALANYLAMVEGNQAALQKQQQQQASEILKNYQQAMKADRLQNIANAFANMSNYTTERAPFEQVLPNGQVITMRFDKQVPGKQLPTNTTSNVDNYTQMLKTQQAIQPKAVDNTALTEKALSAQAMANRYGEDPLIFLNPDLALEYMKGQNTIANTQTTEQEKRKSVPLNTQADVIKENAIGMNDLMVDAFNNQYNMALEQFKQQNMNDRQAQNLAYLQTIAKFNKEYDAYLQYQQYLYDMEKAKQNADTQLGVANIYSQRQNSTTDPLQDMYKKSQIFSTGMAIQNPTQQRQFWEYVTGNTPGAVTPTQFGTTIDQEQILRSSRRRR